MGAYLVSARKQGLDLVLGHWPIIRAWVLKRNHPHVFTLVPREYHTPSPCTGTKCGRCHSVLFGALYTEYMTTQQYKSVPIILIPNAFSSTVEPRYNEGPRDWRKYFSIYFSVTGVKKIVRYTEDFVV